jgi:hypothetical protein
VPAAVAAKLVGGDDLIHVTRDGRSVFRRDLPLSWWAARECVETRNKSLQWVKYKPHPLTSEPTIDGIGRPRRYWTTFSPPTSPNRYSASQSLSPGSPTGGASFSSIPPSHNTDIGNFSTGPALGGRRNRRTVGSDSPAPRC